MKRKDGKGRVLRNNEYVTKKGRYVYQYKDIKGNRKCIYSWRLMETDPQPKDKPVCESLRMLEKEIIKNSMDGIEFRSKITLNAKWKEYISNKPELKQSTATNYKYMYDKFIKDDIGKMPINSITYSVIKELFNKLIYVNGFKPNSAECINTLLHPVFAIAVRDGLIRLNPTEGIIKEMKKSNDWTKPKRHSLTKEQQNTFLSFVKDHPVYSHWYRIFICLFGTGCRVSEMLGLRWEDILWSENAISINHNLIYRQQDDGTMDHRITTTKTKNSIRLIPLLKEVRECLRQEYVYQEQHGFCMDEIEGYTGFIWKNRYGHVMNPKSINNAIKRIVSLYNCNSVAAAKKSNTKPVYLPIFSAHSMRHTFCTRLCEEETDLKLIQEIMGHADITTTMDIYNESNMERKQERFAKLKNVL